MAPLVVTAFYIRLQHNRFVRYHIDNFQKLFHVPDSDDYPHGVYAASFTPEDTVFVYPTRKAVRCGDPYNWYGDHYHVSSIGIINSTLGPVHRHETLFCSNVNQNQQALPQELRSYTPQNIDTNMGHICAQLDATLRQHKIASAMVVGICKDDQWSFSTYNTHTHPDDNDDSYVIVWDYIIMCDDNEWHEVEKRWTELLETHEDHVNVLYDSDREPVDGE